MADVHIPSSIHDGLTDFLVLSDTADDESAPYIVWLEKGALKFVRLTENLDAKTKHLKGSSFKRILNIGLNERGWFVALKEDGTGVALRTDKDSMGLKHLWEFAESAVSDRYSESIYTGGLDKDNFPYVGRVFWSHYLSVRPQISSFVSEFEHLHPEDGLGACFCLSPRQRHRTRSRLYLPIPNRQAWDYSSCMTAIFFLPGSLLIYL